MKMTENPSGNLVSSSYFFFGWNQDRNFSVEWIIDDLKPLSMAHLNTDYENGQILMKLLKILIIMNKIQGQPL